MDGNYSLADLRAVTDGADGISGGSAWLIILFFLIFGFGGGYGFGGRAANAAGEVASTESIISSQRFDSLSKQINQIGDGLSSLGYSQLQQMDANTASINGNVVNEGRTTQNMISSYACENQKNVDALRFDISNYAAQINSNIDSKFAALEKGQLQAQINAQAAQISQLQLSQAVCGIPKVSTSAWGVYPYAAPVTCNCGTV